MGNTYYVDDITYSDLELDDIYKLINHTGSTAGADVLMRRLRNPYVCVCDEFNDFCSLIDEISSKDNAETALELAIRISQIGELKKYKYNESLEKICSEDKTGNLKHYFYIAFVIISFVMIFVSPGFGIVLFFIALALSVTDYFKSKNILADKLAVFSYIIKMLKITGKIKEAKDIKASGMASDTADYANENSANASVLAGRLEELKKIRDLFKPFTAFSFFIQAGVSTSGNIVSIVLDYVRIIFHADIIKYNNMLGFLKEHKNEAIRLFDIVGDLDAALSINWFKKKFEDSGLELCKPKLAESDTEIQGFVLTDAYHPLIEEPVTNSIETSKNVLLTGSNASGKSTYLKTVAINAIFAQSFCMAFAKEYSAGFMRVYTSMALRDSIKNNESYFMAEIKSLKRIFDAGKSGGKVLCIIDEVLRGTNTVERISASVEVLKALCTDNFLCFAATHDIELTELLKDGFTNYCFKEEYSGGDIKFDYKLHEGSADTRNAIKLLKILGFEDKIVEAAEQRVSKYLSTGSFA